MKTEKFTNNNNTKYLVIFCIVVLVTLVYSQLYTNNFLNWDDGDYIYNNADIKELSIDNCKLFFTKNYVLDYLPITMITFAIDYSIGGKNPTAYTLTNLAFHLINTILVFWFIYTLISSYEDKNERKKSKKPFIYASVVAILFGIHPLNVESVAWISERKNVVSTFFFFFSLLYYLKYIKNNNIRILLVSLLFFICSLLSKGTAVSLSITLIGIDYLLGRKIFSFKVIVEKVPFFILSLIFGIVAISAQGNFVKLNHPFYQQLIFATYGFINYIIKLVFPFNLSAIYAYPTHISYIYWICLVATLVIIVFFLKYMKRIPPIIMFGILFFLANIVFLIQLIPVGMAIMADRYIYISGIGFFLIVAELIYSFKNYSKQLFFGLTIFIIAFSYLSFERINVWNNSIDFWTTVIEYDKNIPSAWLNRGVIEHEQNDLKGAFNDFNTAISINPKDKEAYYDRGNIYKQMGNKDKALIDYNKAISLDSMYYEAYFNRGEVKKDENNYISAISDFTSAIKWNPRFKAAYNLRGVLYFLTGKNDSALMDLSKAIEIDPGYENAIYNKNIIENKLKSGN